jgi:hypothetical protein
MAVYRGVLEEISEGRVISSQGTGFSARWGFGGRIIVRETGVDAQAGWTSREFVDVGGQRIRNVMLTPRHDQLLKEAVGQEVALSMTGPNPSSPKRHTTIAIRTATEGLVRPAFARMIAGSGAIIIRGLIIAPFAFLFLFVVAWVAGSIIDPLWWVGLAVAVAGSAWLLLSPFVISARTFRAWSAL